MWFRNLLGFDEKHPDQVRDQLHVADGIMSSKANGRSFRCGELETPSLQELRVLTESLLSSGDQASSITEIVANVEDLHGSSENAGALFQVASQFNLLEMVNPGVTPEAGVDIYERDFTQGPACAIACGAGTVYRNYFSKVGPSQIGQTKECQIDCLSDLGGAMKNEHSRLWQMENGYCFATRSGLQKIGNLLKESDEREVDALRSKLRIGMQWNTEVTLSGAGHLVSQAYCSALPVAYSVHSESAWEPFARLILEASYEATLRAAMLNFDRNGRPDVYLTLLGGGAFGNAQTWILDAMARAFRITRSAGLKVQIVNFAQSDPNIRQFAERLTASF